MKNGFRTDFILKEHMVKNKSFSLLVAKTKNLSFRTSIICNISCFIFYQDLPFHKYPISSEKKVAHFLLSWQNQANRNAIFLTRKCLNFTSQPPCSKILVKHFAWKISPNCYHCNTKWSKTDGTNIVCSVSIYIANHYQDKSKCNLAKRNRIDQTKPSLLKI